MADCSCSVRAMTGRSDGMRKTTFALPEANVNYTASQVELRIHFPPAFHTALSLTAPWVVDDMSRYISKAEHHHPKKMQLYAYNVQGEENKRNRD